MCGFFYGGGTYAYYSDTEIASDNTFESGTLNLKVGAVDPCTESISISNLSPGDYGTADSWLLSNIGSITGDLSIDISTITSNENTRYEMETVAGDTTDAGGELEDYLKVAIWMDKDTSGTWNSGDYYLEDDATTVDYVSSGLPTEAFNFMSDYASDSWTDVQTNLGNRNIGTLKIEYSLADSATIDQAQSDSCVFDITFTLDQSA
ncbi:TasA family protein [Methanolobus sp. ZRKC3]|uniref:TasA family protein n=1 Tax=Methanolobus sp. ZRKC3 TaxID=3125786 RepID=UPI0032540D08